MQKSYPDVFFHVGLGKTGSTYLQYRFFPKLKGISYIQRTRFWSYPKYSKRPASDKLLFSREFDRQLERESKKFASYFPYARPIIILRRHDGWIASQYRRYVKNGGHLSFGEFIDIQKNDGLWDKKVLSFFDKIRFLEDHFQHKPFILFQEELKNDPFSFFDKMATFLGADYSKKDVSLKPYHQSYSEKQLKYMRKWGRKILPEKPSAGNSFIYWLTDKFRLHLCHLLLFAARFGCGRKVEHEPLIESELLQIIRDAYDHDWQQCLDYAKKHNPV
ncbi:MAG: hypothetical protein ACOC31_02065 [Bacteroidota bacterium]